MGHKRQRKTLSLRFEDEPGLEILARSVSVRKFLWVMEQADKMTAGQLTQQAIEELFGWFAERIISWNLVDDEDQPVPVSADYLIDEDVDWVIKVFMGWVSGITKVMRLPLEVTAPEPDGTPEPPEMELDLPMQPAMPG